MGEFSARIAPATAPLAENSRRWWLRAMVVIGLATVAVYFRSLPAPFVFDDHPAIERNESIRRLWPLAGVLRPPNTTAGAAGRPIVNLTLALNYAAGGSDARGYHAVNLAIHLGAVLVLGAVLRRTFRRQAALRPAADGLAAGIALAWAVHPLATESVVCIVQRNELLAAFFFLLTLYGFIRATAPAARANRWKLLSFASCALGMASKEVMVGAPLLVLLYDRTFVAGSWGVAWRMRWRYYVALATTWLLLAGLVAGHEQRRGTVGFGLGTRAWDYLVTQCQAIALYLKLAVWPHPLVLDYGFELAPGLGAVWPQALLIVALLLATLVALWRCPAWGFLGACFFILLAPSSSVLPLTTQTIAEHRMYLPLAALLAAFGVGLWMAGRRGGAPLALAIVAAWSGLAFARVEDYRTEASIWVDTVAKWPRNPRAHASLAGLFAREERWPEALARYEEALRLRPDYADAQNDYAGVLARVGRSEDALVHYELAQRLKPDDDDIRYNRGVALAQLGRFEAAIENFRAVAERNPRQAAARNNLGDALLKTGRPAEALRAFESSLVIDPESAAAHNNAGIVLVALGRFEEALPHYEAALGHVPGSAQVHHNFALALDGARRGPEAIAQEEAAIALEPGFSAAREHLARLRAVR